MDPKPLDTLAKEGNPLAPLLAKVLENVVSDDPQETIVPKEMQNDPAIQALRTKLRRDLGRQ